MSWLALLVFLLADRSLAHILRGARPSSHFYEDPASGTRFEKDIASVQRFWNTGGHLPDPSKREVPQSDPDERNEPRFEEPSFEIPVSKKHKSWHQKRHGWGRMWLAIIFGSVVCFWSYKILKHFINYRSTTNGERSFRVYLRYQFEDWYTREQHPQAMIIGGAFISTVLMGGVIYTAINHTPVIIGTWRIFTWILNPGCAASVPEDHLLTLVFAGFMGCFGLSLFGCMLTLMQSSFMEFLLGFHSGRTAVTENRHIMIIGMTDETTTLVEELCEAYEPLGGIPIVVFSHSFTKQEIERRFEEHKVNVKNSRLIVRCGKPWVTQDLADVGAQMAKCIIMLPNRSETKETQDAFMLETLVTLRQEGWPTDGRIVVVCSKLANHKMFKEIGGENTDIMMLDYFLAKIMVQCSEQSGLSAFYKEIFRWNGSEMYITKVPDKLDGCTFSDATQHYKSAIPFAVLHTSSNCPSRRPSSRQGKRDATTSMCLAPNSSPGLWRRTLSLQLEDAAALSVSSDNPDGEPVQCSFCPGSNYRLSAGQEIVVLAMDENRLEDDNINLRGKGSKVPSSAIDEKEQVVDSDCSEQGQGVGTDEEPGDKPETVIFIGWNDLSSALVLELDQQLPSDSTLITLSHVPVKERNKRMSSILKNWEQVSTGDDKPLTANFSSINHLHGEVSSRRRLDALPVPISEASRVFILLDSAAENLEVATAWANVASLQIEDILCNAGKDTHVQIIREIRDNTAEDKCHFLCIPNAVNTAKLPSQILSMMAYNHKIHIVVAQMISRSQMAGRFAIKQLDDYMDTDDSLSHRTCTTSFGKIVELVQRHDEIAIGWTKDSEDQAEDEIRVRNRSSSFCNRRNSVDYLDFEINPLDRKKERSWNLDYDRIVVLTLRDQ